VRLFDRRAAGAVLTEDGELLHRRVAEGFRSIEAGLREIERRRSGTETVTLSVSSAFTTHWLMPRLDKLQRRFPTVDLRFQLIAGSLRGPVENVDLGMRFVDPHDPAADPGAALLMREVMVPICSPSYLADGNGGEGETDGNTIINLADMPGNWAAQCADFRTGRTGQTKTLNFSDYAVVVQAALLGQGIALGWITVASHCLLAGTLVPASDTLMTGRRLCKLVYPRNSPVRPVVTEIRDWIVAQMRADIDAIDALYPRLGLLAASY
jgi:DNA-binding transcriptional LysR family regulator